MDPSLWIDQAAEPPRRLPSDTSAALGYLSQALGVTVYTVWTPATLQSRFGSMAEAKAAQPAVFAQLVASDDCSEVIQYWHDGRIVTAPPDRAPSPDVVLARLLRVHARRFQLCAPDGPIVTHWTEPVSTGPGAVPSTRIDPVPWMSRTGRYFNRHAETRALAADSDGAALRTFLKDCAGQSPHTLRAYVTELRRLAGWCESRGIGPLSDLTREDLQAYRDALIRMPRAGSAGALGPRTVARALKVVKSAFSYLSKTGYLVLNPARSLGSSGMHRSPVAAPRILPEKAARACDDWLAAQAAHPDPGFRRLRRAAIVALYRFSGARLAELAWADGYPRLHVKAEAWTLEVKGKGDRLRAIPLPRICVEHLRRYRSARGEPADPVAVEDMPLIHGARGHGLGVSGLYREIKAAFSAMLDTLPDDAVEARVALDIASPHWLRHAYVHRLVVIDKIPLPAVQSLVGHVSIQTTASYARTDLSQLRGFVERSFDTSPPALPGADKH